MELLLIGRDDGCSRRFSVPDGETLIGRRPDCHIVLDAPTIAPRHARVFSVDGRTVIYGLTDDWPVYVNGDTVDRRVLAHGDDIELAHYTLRCVDENGEDSTARGPHPAAPEPGSQTIQSAHRAQYEIAPPLAKPEMSAPALETPDTDPPSPETSVQDESTRELAVRDEAVRDEAVRDEAVRDEAVRDEAVRDEAVRDEAGRDEAGRDEASRDEASRDEASRDEASRSEPGWDGPGQQVAAAQGRSEDAGADDAATRGRPSAAVSEGDFLLDILSGINQGRCLHLGHPRVVLGFNQQRLVEIVREGSGLAVRAIADQTGVLLNGEVLPDQLTPVGTGDVLSVQRIELRVQQRLLPDDDRTGT